MMKMERVDPPQWLSDDWEQWGREWKISNSQGKEWSWRVGDVKKRELTTQLKRCTKYHCSYCDSWPIGKRTIKDTIDHFRPKSNFELIAYQWENLFIACHYCQEKGSKFDELLLKPDEETYDFDEYFKYDKDSGKLIPNPKKSAENQERAAITIDFFKLNGIKEEEGTDDDIALHRKVEYKKHIGDDDLLNEIDVHPWRYMFT